MATDSSNQPSSATPPDPWKIYVPGDPQAKVEDPQAKAVNPQTKAYATNPDAAPTASKELRSLSFRVKNASLQQINSSHIALKNKDGSASLQQRVSKHFTKVLWICIFVRNEKEWVRWVKREARFVEELIKLKRLDERHQRTWSQLRDNFHKELIRLQDKRLEAQSEKHHQL